MPLEQIDYEPHALPLEGPAAALIERRAPALRRFLRKQLARRKRYSRYIAVNPSKSTPR